MRHAKRPGEPAQRLAAVRKLVFRFRWQLRRRAAVRGDEKDRVVAEAVVAHRRTQDAPLPCALADDGRGVEFVAQVHQHALEARRAFFIRHVLDIVEQFQKVRLVARPLAGVARRVDTRGAVQCVHFQTGVIGDRRQAGEARSVTRLEQRILDERESGFLGLGHLEVGLRHH